MSEKRKYLVAYDYGMGGLWGYLWARSPEEIAERYPELKIVHTVPLWMTAKTMNRLEERSTYYIDEPPTGMMLAVVNDRSHP